MTRNSKNFFTEISRLGRLTIQLWAIENVNVPGAFTQREFILSKELGEDPTRMFAGVHMERDQPILLRFRGNAGDFPAAFDSVDFCGLQIPYFSTRYLRKN